MIPLVPFKQNTSEPIRPQHISENMEVVARDIRDNILQRWMRTTTIHRLGAMTNTSPAAHCKLTIPTSTGSIVSGIYLGLYSASTVTVTVSIDGSAVFTKQIVGGGATTRVDWIEALAGDNSASYTITVVVTGSGTWSVDELHVGLAIEHDRFQFAPPAAPTPTRFGYTTPAALRTSLNTFNAAADTAVDADTAADEQTDYDVLRGPSGVADTFVTADRYTYRIQDLKRTIKTASLVLVADSGVTVTATIANASAVTQHVLTAAGTGTSNEIIDTDVVGDTQPGGFVYNSGADWTVVFAVSAGTGTIHECYLVLEWE
jgi:hypothetical protein